MLFSDMSLLEVLFFVIAFGVIFYLIINAPTDSESHKECGSSKAIPERFKIDKSKKV